MNRFDEQWRVVEKAIAKLKAMLAGEPEPPFTAEDYMMIYSTVYHLFNSNQEQRLRVYNMYKITFEDYLSSTVLPSLQEKHGEFLLRDFATRWSNHKHMAFSMNRFFHYLDRFYLPQMCLPQLKEVSSICFQNLVYANIKGKICDAVLFLIDQEREGHEVDRALLKSVVDAFVEIGDGQMVYYVNDFEAPMLERTATYYSQKASNWILQADECLKVEKDRASHYLHPSSEQKLLERVRQELLVVHTAQLQLQGGDANGALRPGYNSSC